MSGDSLTPVMECWICCDSKSPEPLVQPCACKGSMRGVHVSCVEQWVRRQRQIEAAGSDATPRCPVCHSEYDGFEERPARRRYALHLAMRAAAAVHRIAVMPVLCRTLQCSAVGCARLPADVCYLLAAFLTLAGMRTVLVLTTSLPIGVPHPQSPILARFFVTSPGRLGRHIRESCLTAALLGLLWGVGDISLAGLLPYVLASMLPAAKCLILFIAQGRHQLSRGRQAVKVCWIVLVGGPIFVLRIFRRSARRSMYPLSAGPHRLVAFATIPLCPICGSNLFLLALWAVHSEVLVFCLVQVATNRRLRWRRGSRWLFLICDVSVVAVYATVSRAEPCRWFRGDLLRTSRFLESLVYPMSLVWTLLLFWLAMAINWKLCLRHYQNWRRRHGVFRLRVGVEGYVPLPREP